MLFKKEGLKKEFWLLTPKAKLLMCAADLVSYNLFGKPIIVTMIFYRGGKGVHADHRAFDIRVVDYYTEKQIQIFKDTINWWFVYDLVRPRIKTCVRHTVPKEDIDKYEIPEFVPEDHLHLQVWIK